VSQKVVPLACYNFNTSRPILTAVGRNVAAKVSNQMMLYFPISITSASALPGETGNPEIAIS